MSSDAKVVALKAVSGGASAGRMPAALRLLQEKIKPSLQALLRGMFDNADDALFELADRATSNQEQNLYFDSMREVRIKRRGMELAFAQAMTDAFHAVASGAAPLVEDDDDEPDLDSLSLVQNEELEELVAVDSMVTKANDRFSEPLQHLSLRLDSLVPAQVLPSTNPLGPKVLCHGFLNAANELEIDIKAKLVLFKLFDRYVTGELGKIYDSANKLLIEQGVLPDLKDKLKRQQRRAGRPAAGRSGREVAPASEDSQVFNSLRELMAAGGEGRGEDLPTGDALRGDELMQVLSQLQRHQMGDYSDLSDADMLEAEKINLSQALAGFVRTQQGMQRSLGQMDQDVINLVNMLFEFILDDRNLAVPMKALIGRLQIPILKVALADKSFFNKGGHPARRLLNEIATAALGWQDDGNRERDPLYRKVEEIVQHLLTDFEADVGIFNELLTDFLAFIEKEQRRANLLEQRTIDAEDGKARAENARRVVNQLLEEKTAGLALPGVVQKILYEAWSNVLFLAYLKEGADSENWATAVATADDLIWSVTVPVAGEQRGRLLKLVPSLLKRMREGLESVSFNPFEMSKLFTELERLHISRFREAKTAAAQPAPAAKAPAEKSPAAKAPIDTASAAKAPAQQAPADKAPMERAPAEKAASQQAPVQKPQAEKAPVESAPAPTTPAQPAAATTKPASSPAAKATAASANAAPAPAAKPAASATPASTTTEAEPQLPADDQHLQTAGRMTMGCWVEFRKGEEKFRARLAAVLKPTGKYIFVNRTGMKVADMTQNQLGLALKEGNVSLLDDALLFDRALESVIGNLRQSRGH